MAQFGFLCLTLSFCLSLVLSAPPAPCNWLPTTDTRTGLQLSCQLRTLRVDFWNYTLSRDQVERTTQASIQCHQQLLFESFLQPNQNFFQLTSLRTLSIEFCKIRRIPKNLWLSLSGLRNLTLRSFNGDWSPSFGMEIEAEAFTGLANLENLDLSSNNIWSLDQSLFCPLRNLGFLNLSSNQLSEVFQEGLQPDCSGLLSLQKLDLGHNRIRRVGRNGFSKLRRLSELRVDNNYLEELEDSAFFGLSSLKLLNLSTNRLVALPPTLFNPTPNLRELYLQNNSISALSPQVFSGLESLLLLDLSRNSLTSLWIKETVFGGLVRLIVLKLSHNSLSYVDQSLFQDLISLQALHLDNNRIENINPDAFSALSNLHLLDLSRNRLSFIDARLLSNLPVLRQLYLDHNKIRRMDEAALRNATSLQDLGLAGNLLQDVPLALRGASSIQTLDIGENRIGTLSNESFMGLGQLYGLRLVDNRVVELTDGFCDPLKKLRVLNLAQNRLTKVSASSFVGCPELRALRLDTNSLEELPPSLALQLPSLLWLNVSENRLRWADYHLLPPTVEWLDVSYNSLETLGGFASSAKPGSSVFHLRVLDASYNNLTHLDYTTIPPTLETLRVNHNRLKSVAPDTFSRATRIRKVELIGNQLETLPMSALRLPTVERERPLPEFYLGANSFLCDCSMEWLTRVNQLTALRQHPRIVDIDAVLCRPTHSRTTEVIPLPEMEPSHFRCPYTAHCFTLCHCCEFEACDCAMTCPNNCSCFHDTAWSSNIVECSNSEYTNIPERIPMDATEIYLDGNEIPTLGSHIFIGKKNLRVLYLNSSGVEVIRNKTFNGLKALEVLRLDTNRLPGLYGYEFADLDNLRELYLHNNVIESIAPETFSRLQYLQVLRLDGNLLFEFSVWELSVNGYLNSLSLSRNPWSCDCAFVVPFRTWLSSRPSTAADFPLAKCQRKNNGFNEQEQVDMSLNSLCGDGDGSNEVAGEAIHHPQRVDTLDHGTDSFDPPVSVSIPDNRLVWIVILAILVSVLLLGVLMLIFRKQVYYWCIRRELLLKKFCCRESGSSAEKVAARSSVLGEEERLFDAYFIYNQKDEEVVTDKLADTMGNFHLLLHHRDLSMTHNGSPDWNPDVVLSACETSRRVVILLSQTFLQVELNQPESRVTLQAVMHRNQQKLIFILLPPLNEQNICTVYPELRGRRTTLDWMDPDFWSKFRMLLPSPSETSSSGMSTISRPQNESGNYQRNIIPYEYGNQSIARGQTLTRNNSLPVPKHHILLPVPNWHGGNGTNYHNGGPNTATLPHVVYPAPSQPPPQYFSFAENFRHHQQQQPLTFATMQGHQKQSSNSSSRTTQSNSCRPLLRSPQSPIMSPDSGHGHVNFCSSGENSNDELENEHVYSTLDSPLQSPNTDNMEVNYNQTGRRGHGHNHNGPNNNSRTMYFV